MVGCLSLVSIMGSLRGRSITRSLFARPSFLAEEPLEAPRPAARFLLAPLGDPSVVLFLGPGGRLLAEEPPVAPLRIIFGGWGGTFLTSSSPPIRAHPSPVSGGGGVSFSSPPFASGRLGHLPPGRCGRYVHHPVNVGSEAPVPV